MNMFKKIRSGFAVVLCCCAAYSVAPAQNSTSSPAAAASAAPASSGIAPAGAGQMGIRDYRLGTGDLLDLRVMNEPQFDGTLEVNSEGEIFVPFLDASIPAQCRKVDEIRADITIELAKLLRQPRVSLLVKEKRSRAPAVVYGAVRVPQQFQMYRRARLLELVGYAGGFTEQASGTIQVFHTEPLLCPEPGEVVPVVTPSDDLTQLPFDVYSLNDLKAGRAEGNPIIRPGDVVRVDEAAPVYVTGLVLQPQGVYLRPQTTLTTVIAQVGGLRKEAKNEIKIYRRKPDAPSGFETIAVNFSDIRKQKAPDVVLQPYDVIDVGESSPFSRKRIGDTVLGFATQGASSIVGATGGRIVY